MNKSLLVLSVGLALSSVEVVAATLQAGNHLSIEAGSSFTWGGIPETTTAITGNNGLTVGAGAGDTGTGSHGGYSVAGDVGAVTNPWAFLSNTGYDFLSTSNGSGSFGGSTEAGVDMTAWTVTWNGTEIITGGCSLGDPANNGGFSGCDINQDGIDNYTDTGIGTFNWSGVYGDSYTISYTSHGPSGAPDGFSGGLQYDLFLTGTVSAVPVPAAAWLFASGLVGLMGVSSRRKKKA